MSDVTLKDKFVTVRKPRQCFGCHRKFPEGTKMWYWAGVGDGSFGSLYSCPTCHQIMNLCYDDFDEGYPDAFVCDMLNKDQTPEELLELLKKKN